MTKFKLQSGGMTHVGLKRKHNEDSIFIGEKMGLFIVADGMGGHAAGEVASKAVTQALEAQISTSIADKHFNETTSGEALEEIFTAAIHKANDRVCHMAEENLQYFGMGTTIAAMLIWRDKAVIGHVGDSRIYSFKGAKLKLLTKDHSWVNEQLERNIITEEEARNHRWRNVITRALGNKLDVLVDSEILPLTPGDLYLICSDGLTSMIEDHEIEARLRGDTRDLDVVAEDLVRMANDAGGHDNTSVVLVRMRDAAASTTSRLRKRDPAHEPTQC